MLGCQLPGVMAPVSGSAAAAATLVAFVFTPAAAAGVKMLQCMAHN